MPTSVLVDGQAARSPPLPGPPNGPATDAIKLIKAAMEPATAGF